MSISPLCLLFCYKCTILHTYVYTYLLCIYIFYGIILLAILVVVAADATGYLKMSATAIFFSLAYCFILLLSIFLSVLMLLYCCLL